MLDEEYLTLEDVAKRLGVEPKTVGKYVRNGMLKGVKNPISGSVIGFRESDVKEFLKMPVAEEPEHIEVRKDVEANSELAKIKSEIDVAKAKMELELANRNIAGFKEFEKLKTETEAVASKLSERERECREKEQEVETRERAVSVLEEKALYADEERKRLLADAQNRIAKVDEAHRKAREEDDAKRQEAHKQQLSIVDTFAQKVYNPPPQSISNRLQEEMIALLEPIMEAYGIRPQFDTKNSYIPLGDRFSMTSIQVREDGRKKPVISSNGVMSGDMRVCYRACLTVYKWMRQEPNYGYDFCRRVYVMMKRLRWYIKDKSDDEINDDQEAILGLFNKFHRAFMVWAEMYQNAKESEWSQVSDWLCGYAEYLETRLGIGVIEQDTNLPLRMT